jgi:O-antigen/teichoic acid export membrane protein
VNLKKVIGFAFGPIGVAAMSLLTVPLTAWYFQAEDIGKISMLQIAISFCLLVFSLGLDQAYVREYHETNNKQGLFKTCITPGFSLLLISLSVLICFEPSALADWLFGVKDAYYSILIATCILAAYVGRFLSLILRMEEHGWLFSLGQLLPKIIFLIALGLYIYFDRNINFSQLLFSHAAAFTSVILILSWSTRKNWRPKSFFLDAKKQKELLKFGLPLIVGSGAFWAVTSFDKIFLKYFSSYEELGLYTVINSFAGVAIILQNIFTTVWAPAAYKMNSTGIKDKDFKNILNRVLVGASLIFALAGLFSKVLIYILPSKYHDGQYIILALLVYPLMYSLSEVSGIGLGITRKSKLLMLLMMIALCFNILLNYCLIPIYGAAGAASSTALTFFLLFILKTECSNFYWRSFSRVKIYIASLICVVLSVSYCLFGKFFYYYFMGAFIIILILSVVLLVNMLEIFDNA